MSFIVICGKPDCIHFAHANYVAQYLQAHLPNFKYKKIEKFHVEWAKYVDALNKKNKWFAVKSPIIWKEISHWGGKPYLIGGLSEFWEHCFCYYGLESTIPKCDLQKLADDNVKFLLEEQQKQSKQEKFSRVVISIFGASNLITSFLIKELLNVPALINSKGFLVKLFDPNQDQYNETEYLENVLMEYNGYMAFGNKELVKLVDTDVAAIEGCDLLIHLQDFSRLETENELEWLSRCLDEMSDLADNLNDYAKRSVRVIFANQGPVCFLATCVVEFCPLLHVANIVAVTSDQGLPVINAVSELSKVPVSKMTAPPVWGFVGMNHFVDEANIIFKAEILRPYARTLTAPEGSTLPLGTVVTELRSLSYLILDQHDQIVKMVEEGKEKMVKRLGRKPILSKLRALMSLINIWYSEKETDQIISLGVFSDGSFDVPFGMVFSQPAVLDEKLKWRPFRNFPLKNKYSEDQVKNCIDFGKEILDKFDMFKVNEERSNDDNLFEEDLAKL